mgnify:CR=1 FL=1
MLDNQVSLVNILRVYSINDRHLIFQVLDLRVLYTYTPQKKSMDNEGDYKKSNPIIFYILSKSKALLTVK